MTDQHPLDRIRPATVPQDSLPWVVGIARLCVLAVAVVGTLLPQAIDSAKYMLAVYACGFLFSLSYILSLLKKRTADRKLTWVQVMMDFAVIAVTIGSTGGSHSIFAFLFVVLVLEAGLLLGFFQSIAFASLAMITMLVQVSISSPSVELWYNLLLQGLAFYFTSFISGYWNQQLNRLQLFQKDILDNLNSGFIITDKYGAILAQNKAANRILNLSDSEQTLGRPISDLILSESGSECPVITAFRSGRDFTRYEFLALTPDGQQKLLGLTTSHIFDTKGRLTGLIASFSDLTEMAEMRQDLQRQDRMAVIGELAAGLAHDIRNPVAAIRGAVDEIRNRLSNKEMTDKLAEIAIREADHLDDIVAGFLNFARNPIVEREAFDMNDLVTEVCELVKDAQKDITGLEVESRVSHWICWISADRSQLKQVLVNLTQNAAEAAGNDGKVVVSVFPGTRSLEVRVEDDGAGITPDKVAHIFEPFYTTKTSGVGMGLAVCQRIVTAHDGTIRVTSRENGGTCMSVRLPAASHDSKQRIEERSKWY